MNQQLIDQLLHKAGAHFGGDGINYSGFEPSKFAQLIVEKCMDVAKYHTPDTEECEYTWLIHDKIEEYFGVKE